MKTLRRFRRQLCLRAPLLAVPILVLSATATFAGAPDGRAIFLSQKCNMCHSVSSAGIEATVKAEKMKGPDLVGVAAEAPALKDYLMQKSEMNGKKHPKKAGGSEDDLKALIDWIKAQKK